MSSMNEVVTRPFVADVLSRMTKTTGLKGEEKTVKNYVLRVMTIKKIGFAEKLLNPESLYEALKIKYGNAASIMTLLRPAAVFMGNLSNAEWMSISQNSPVEAVLKDYTEVLKKTTTWRKEQSLLKRVNALND